MLDTTIEYADRVRPSLLSYHNGDCCREARAWFLNMDRLLYAHDRALPVWIQQRYEWGPSPWPIHWCEAVKAKRLDCGAHSALALEAFAQRGIIALLCQTIRKFDPRTIEQWRASWERAGCVAEWASGEFAYHETVAILHGSNIEVWDPSSNSKVRFNSTPGYGSTVALRIPGPEGWSGGLMWGPRCVPMNRWVVVDSVSMPSEAECVPALSARWLDQRTNFLKKLALKPA